jgi:hypothetical protein
VTLSDYAQVLHGVETADRQSVNDHSLIDLTPAGCSVTFDSRLRRETNMKSNTLVAFAVAITMAGTASEALAARKSTSNGAPTSEQRKKMFEAGLKSCRKKYGALLHDVKVEKFYGRWTPVCYVY